MDENNEGLNWPERSFKNEPKKLEKHFEQRKSRGFSDIDWWSFDTFIAGVIAQGVEKFRDDGVAHPADLTLEEWQSLCTEISEPLMKYAEDKFNVFGDESDKLHDDAIRAMKKFSDRFGDWWD